MRVDIFLESQITHNDNQYDMEERVYLTEFDLMTTSSTPCSTVQIGCLVMTVCMSCLQFPGNCHYELPERMAVLKIEHLNNILGNSEKDF